LLLLFATYILVLLLNVLHNARHKSLNWLNIKLRNIAVGKDGLDDVVKIAFMNDGSLVRLHGCDSRRVARNKNNIWIGLFELLQKIYVLRRLNEIRNASLLRTKQIYSAVNLVLLKQKNSFGIPDSPTTLPTKNKHVSTSPTSTLAATTATQHSNQSRPAR
jgi:hypothetical protein